MQVGVEYGGKGMSMRVRVRVRVRVSILVRSMGYDCG